jgi:hypothetical protein
MDWLKEAIEKYETLSESEQAHVDAACDALNDPKDADECICGEKECPEEYAHMTGGF